MIPSSKTYNHLEKGLTMKVKAKYSLTVVACAFLLAACGGGGGSGSQTGPVAPVTPPVVTPPASDIQTSVPAPTYTAASQELAFFNAYNDFRGALGLGKLKQDNKLDLANQNHVAYLLANTDINTAAIDSKTGRPLFHIEDPVRPKFTGVTEKDRASFAGYGGVYVAESGAYGAGRGAVSAFNDFVATVYHRAGLVYQSPRDIGLAVGNDAKQTVVMTFGYATTGQKNASDYFGVYPADKQTNVPLISALEAPNPYPDITYAEYATKTSFPISVASEESTTLSVTSFTVTQAGTAAALDARLLTQATDPNKYLSKNTAYLVAKSAFKPNTTYNVSFTGTVNGVAMSKSWSFTTGS